MSALSRQRDRREDEIVRIQPPKQANHETRIEPGKTFPCPECHHLVGKNPSDVVCAAHGRVCTHCARLHKACRRAA